MINNIEYENSLENFRNDPHIIIIIIINYYSIKDNTHKKKR